MGIASFEVEILGLNVVRRHSPFRPKDILILFTAK